MKKSAANQISESKKSVSKILEGKSRTPYVAWVPAHDEGGFSDTEGTFATSEDDAYNRISGDALAVADLNGTNPKPGDVLYAHWTGGWEGNDFEVTLCNTREEAEQLVQTHDVDGEEIDDDGVTKVVWK